MLIVNYSIYHYRLLGIDIIFVYKLKTTFWNAPKNYILFGGIFMKRKITFPIYIR